MRHGSRITRTFRTITLVVSLATIFSTAFGSSYAFANITSGDTTTDATASATPTPDPSPTEAPAPDPSPTDTPAPTETSASADPTATDPAPLDTPTISSDKSDYHPGETVNLTGDGWGGDDNVRIVVNDDAGQTWRRDVIVNVGAAGGISDTFTLPSSFVAVYSVTATGQQTSRVATTSFTDGPIIDDWRQCENGPPSNGLPIDCTWITGGISPNASSYTEGDSVGQRYFIEFTTAGSHKIRLSYSNFDSSKNAVTYDFLTTPDFSQGSHLVPCGDNLPNALTTTRCNATFGDFSVDIPDANFNYDIVSGGTNYGNVLAHKYGPSPELFMGCDPDCSGNTGQALLTPGTVKSEPGAYLEITVTTPAGTTAAAPTLVGVWFGAHLASANPPFQSGKPGWGAGRGASSAAGASFHVLTECNDPTAAVPNGCTGGGSRDNQLQAGAVAPPASLTVVKDAQPDDPQDFTYTTSANLGVPNNSFTLDDNGNANDGTSNTFTVNNLIAGTYTVAEGSVAGWTLNSLTCQVAVVNGGSYTVNPASQANVVIKAGENWTCTYVNVRQTGSIKITKYHDLNANGTDDTEPRLNGWTFWIESGTPNGTLDAGETSGVTSGTSGGLPLGEVTFNSLPTGSYTVCEQLIATWINSDPGGTAPYCKTIAVTASTQSTRKFGNYQNVSQSVLKYHDLDASGGQNGSEPGLPGWEFFVDKNANGVWDSGVDSAKQTTGAAGTTSFTLAPGSTYSICEVNQATWINSDPGGSTLCKTTDTITSGVATTQLKFGNYQNVSQSVLKYHDLDASGGQNGSEPGLPGWEFFVDKNANGVWDSGVDSAKQTTGAAGTTSFTLAPGSTYSICEVNQATWINSDPGGSTLCKTTDTITSGVATTQLKFGNYQNVSQSVLKYHDLDASGGQNGSEPGLPGWEFFVDKNANGVWDSGVDSAKQTTGAAGTTSFTLAPGSTYSICEVNQATWINSDPGGSTLCKTTDTITSGVATTQLKFGNYQNVSQSVLKYHDLDASGGQNGSEPGLPGWEFFVDKNANGVWDSGVDSAKQTTGAAGTTSFTLAPGSTYSICEVNQATWINSDPGGSTLCKTTDTITSGVATTQLKFGNYQNVSQSVLKYHDLDASGGQNGSEPGLPGWEFFVDKNANGVWDSGVDSAKQTTGAAGTTSFTLAPGSTYSICEVNQATWINSDPGGSTLCKTTDTITSGVATTQLKFGNYQNVSQSVLKYHDLDASGGQNGSEPGLPGWEFFVDKNANGVWDSGVDSAKQTTGAAGTTSFTLAPGSTYSICEVNQATWINSDPGGSTLCKTTDTITSGVATTQLKFGNYQNVSQSVLKYHDLDASGGQNGSEPGLPGWEFFVDKNANGVWDSGVDSAKQTTGAAGTTSFTLAPGSTYSICEVNQATWINSDPGGSTLCKTTDTITSGVATTQLKFGNYQNVSQSVLKYHDLDASGGQNGSEPGLPGWEFFVDKNANGVWDSGVDSAKQTTGAAGTTSFTLAPGSTYSICEVNQATWINSDPGGSTLCKTTDTITSGVATTQLKFGNYQNVSQSVLKYHDLDASGGQNGSEPGLPGWEFFVDKNANGVWDSGVDSAKQTTGAAGTTSFTLAPGSTYSICEVNQATWINSDPGGSTLCKTTDTITSGVATTQLKFGNYQNVSQSVLKYHDLDASGGQNGSEPGLPGWEFFVDKNANGVWDSGVDSAKQTTGAAGTTSFTLAPGSTYSICEVNQATWINSDPGGSTLCKTTDTITSGVATTQLKFGNYQNVSQSVLKYHDLDASGGQNGSEPGLPGWEFFVDKNANGVWDSGVDSAKQTTGAAGTTSFTLAPGSTYSICEVNQATWINSDPGGSTLCKTTDTITSGVATTQLKFGNYQNVSQSVLKYHDLDASGGQNGSEPGLPGWEFFVDKNANGVWDSGVDSAKQTTGAAGTTSFTLAPGSTYSICEVNQATWINSDPGGSTLCKTTDTITSGVATTQLKFGNYQNVSQSVLKYHDLDASGGQNGSEPGLPGWEFFVDKNANGTFDAATETTQTTDANGLTSFTLKPGASYSICEINKTNWVNSDPGGSTLCKTTATIVSGTATTQLKYGNYQPVKIQVTKTVLGGAIPAGVTFTFNIRSGAVPDPAGPNGGFGTKIAHGTVNSADNVINGDDWIVDAAGKYPLKPGTYQICEVIVNGFTPSFVLNGTYGTGAGQWFEPGVVGGPGYSPAENSEACFSITVVSGDGGTTHTVALDPIDNTPPGMSRTIGYWKNWTSCDGSGGQKPVLDDMIASASDNWTATSSGEPIAAPNSKPDIRLGDRVIEGSTACAVAVDILDKRLTAADGTVGDGKKAADSPAWNAGSQLLAYELNQLLNPGSSCAAANTAAIYTRRILNKIGFTGKTNPTMSAAEKTALNYYAGILDNYNNNTLLCGSSVQLLLGVPGASFDYLP